MINFEPFEKEDLTHGPSRASMEGRKNLLDHRWIWMAIVVFFAGVILRNSPLVALTGFMIGVVLFAWYWNRHVLGSIRYQRVMRQRRAFPGEQVEVQIVIENRKRLPVTWLQVEDEWPSGFSPLDENIMSASSGSSMSYLVNVYSLRWYERVRRRYTLVARERGIYLVGPAHLLSGDPFGLFEDEGDISHTDRLIVYPAVKPLEELGFDAKDPFGDIRVAQRLYEDPSRTMGVREHRPDDSFRHVHWSATARTGTLQVRQYEPTRTQSVVLCLNIASFDEQIRGVWPQMVEYVIMIGASLASWAVEQQYAVGLIANATLAQTDKPLRTQPGRSRDQLANLLEAMAGITYFVTSDYSRFVVTESTRMPWGATLVAVTGFINDDILASLIRLRHSGRRIVLIVLGKTAAPYIPGIVTYHMPIAVEEPEEEARQKVTRLDDDGNEVETARQRYLRTRAARDAEKLKEAQP